MKKIYFLLFACCIAMVSCGSDEMVRYTNHEKGYSIELPKKWDRIENYVYTDITAKQPVSESSGIFISNITVVSETLKAHISNETYYKMQFKTIASMSKEIHNFKLLENRQIMLGGEQGKALVYSFTLGQMKVKVISYAVVRGGKGYIITGTSTGDGYKKLEPVFMKSAESFRFE